MGAGGQGAENANGTESGEGEVSVCGGLGSRMGESGRLTFRRRGVGEENGSGGEAYESGNGSASCAG